MKKKKIVLFLSVLLSLMGCTQTEGSEGDSLNTANLETEKAEALEEELSDAFDNAFDVMTAPETEVQVQKEEKPWESFYFELNGISYRLPCTYAELVNNGWSQNEYDDETELTSNSMISFTMSDGQSKIRVGAINLSGDSKCLKDCKIGTLNVRDCDLADSDVFKMSEGISTDSSKDEIISKIGEADEEQKSEESESLFYGDSYRFVSFIIFPENPEVNQINIWNIESDESDVSQTNVQVPEYLSEYKAPEKLGETPLSMTVDIDGDLYTLPAPVTEFLNNGWSIREEKEIGAGANGSIVLERNEKWVSVDVKNFAKYQTIAENCAVSSIGSFEDMNEVSVILSGNITLGTTKEDLEQLLPEAFEYRTQEYDNTFSFSYSGKDAVIYLTGDNDSQIVKSIFVQNNAWTYEKTGN